MSDNVRDQLNQEPELTETEVEEETYEPRYINKDESLERYDEEDVEPLLTPEEQIAPVTLELTQAFKTPEGIDLTQLTVSPPKAKDMIKFQRMKMDETKRSILWFATLTGQPPETIEELHVRDFRRLSIVVNAFAE